ncbi:unnamed protein product [Rotaria sp. Silwood2]|nr:unnamed protein product [Rotaria sp. Silwood2]
MLKSGIIVPSHSPWSSPVILLKKPNGEFRFIVDYRRLNAITRKDSYPQPTTEELLQRLGGHKWFTKLDLKSGYFQIPIQDCDKEKTAFCTQDGLYQFEVLSMGLMNAPSTFQRVMNNIIGYKRWDFVLQYLGGRDVTIFTDHKPLEQFHKKNHFNCKRIDEWLLKHQDIIPQILDVKYKKGCLHGDADGLSRPDFPGQNDVSSSNKNEDFSLNVVTRSMARKIENTNHYDSSPASTTSQKLPIKHLLTTFDFGIERIREEQMKDPNVQHIMKNIQEKLSYVMYDDIVHKIIPPSRFRPIRQLIYIPSSMRREVLSSYHDHPTAAHFGSRRTWTKLRERCYWPHMRKEIENYVQSCEKCAKYNIKRTKPSGKLNPIPPPEGLMELIGMDFWGPTRQESISGNKSCWL